MACLRVTTAQYSFKLAGSFWRTKILSSASLRPLVNSVTFLSSIDSCQCEGSIHCLETLHILLQPESLSGGLKHHVDLETMICMQVPVLKLCD